MELWLCSQQKLGIKVTGHPVHWLLWLLLLAALFTVVKEDIFGIVNLLLEVIWKPWNFIRYTRSYLIHPQDVGGGGVGVDGAQQLDVLALPHGLLPLGAGRGLSSNLLV